MINLLSNKFNKTDDGVWVDKHSVKDFGYTDGAHIEKYLENVFRNATDLSSDSRELETHIYDWNTEYHLTKKRKNLLSNLTYNPEHSVMEIGCGCGAISRFLGETFKSVTSVEGSYERARLARLRTKDLETVEVVNSRFQDLGLSQTFDAIFCIGVWEYSPSYVNGEHPFTTALEEMKKLLKPGGYIVLAIENQFGLKYLANSREDHTGTFFESIEGYPRFSDRVATFGKKELTSRLSILGDTVSFYYPFPDYKIPDALLSETLFEKVNCGELVGSFNERDYAGQKKPYFDSKLAWHQVAQNGLIPDMSNSFLVVVGGKDKPDLGDSLGYIYNTQRTKEFATITKFTEDKSDVIVTKTAQYPDIGSFDKVAFSSDQSNWLDEDTIAFSVFTKSHLKSLSFKEQFADAHKWWDHISKNSKTEGGKQVISGDYLDLLWHNTTIVNNECVFFDRELSWHSTLESKILLARAALLWTILYHKSEFMNLRSFTNAGKVKLICREFGAEITREDINNLIDLEATVQNRVGGQSFEAAQKKLKGQLFIPEYRRLKSLLESAKVTLRRLNNLRRKLF